MTAPAGLAEALAAAPAGLATWDADGRLTWRNEAFAALYAEHEALLRVGCSFRAFAEGLAASGAALVGDAPADWVRAQLAAFETGGSAGLAFSDGAAHELTHARLRDGGAVTVARDDTLRRAHLRTLERARERAETADVAKSRFLRAANHDLRQPMATLKILVYRCLTTEDEAHRRELLHAMDVSIAIMEDLLGALLQIGQLDAGAIQPRVGTFQVSQILERMRIEFGHQAASRGLRLTVAPCSAAARSDKALLERIVSNLVSNAVKHTRRGRVLVGCRRRGDRLSIEVRDTGPGLPPDELGRIFDEFYQAPGAAGDLGAQRGLGLGLNIVKRLAELLEHRVVVRSTPGRGSLFAVEVPLGDVRQSAIGPEISELIGGEFADVEALLVEDDETLRAAVSGLLERWGIRVRSATGLAQVRRLLEEGGAEPDIILADYSLREGVNGADVAAFVAERLGRAVPGIIMTADTAPAQVAAIRARGRPVLIKPVSPPRLRVLMHNLLFEPEALDLSGADDA